MYWHPAGNVTFLVGFVLLSSGRCRLFQELWGCPVLRHLSLGCLQMSHGCFVGQPAACCCTCKPREAQRKRNERCCTWIYCSPPSCQSDTYFFLCRNGKVTGSYLYPASWYKVFMIYGDKYKQVYFPPSRGRDEGGINIFKILPRV